MQFQPNKDGFPQSADIYVSVFNRLAKNQIRTDCWDLSVKSTGDLGLNINDKSGSDLRQAWAMLLDLTTIAHTVNKTTDKEILSQGALDIWKNYIALRPQLGFSERIRPEKISLEDVNQMCGRLMELKVYRDILPKLEREIKLSKRDRNRFKHLPPAPIQKAVSIGYIENYMDNENESY